VNNHYRITIYKVY